MLNVQNLSCRRGGRFAFRGASFQADRGNFVLVTGANGSGKSSLLRVLAGLIEPKGGSVEWQGKDITKNIDAHHSRMRYIGHLDSVKPLLTVKEMLEYWQALRDAPVANWQNALDAFALRGLVDTPIAQLSAGQKRRLSLSRLALGESALWLLDEPTTALDTKGKDLLRAQIAQYRSKGGIVIAATHEDFGVPDPARVNMEWAIA